MKIQVQRFEIPQLGTNCLPSDFQLVLTAEGSKEEIDNFEQQIHSLFHKKEKQNDTIRT